jgi:hypothetical protein
MGLDECFEIFVDVVGHAWQHHRHRDDLLLSVNDEVKDVIPEPHKFKGCNSTAGRLPAESPKDAALRVVFYQTADRRYVCVWFL